MHLLLSKRLFRYLGSTLLSLALVGCATQGGGRHSGAGAPGASEAAQVMDVADTVRERGDLASALMLYRRARELEPEAPAPLVALGNGFRQLQRYDEAQQAYGRALQLDKGNADALHGYALLLIETGQPERATALLSPAVSDDATDGRLHNALGVAYDLLGDHTAAQQAYRTGLRQRDDDLSLRNNLALSLALQNRYDEATSVLRQVLESKRATDRHRQNLALIHGLAGRADKAAALGRIDLTEEQVAGNLARYDRLRKMPAEERHEALLSHLFDPRPPADGPDARPDVLR